MALAIWLYVRAKQKPRRITAAMKGTMMYILFAVPAISLATIFAISLRSHFARFTDV